MKNYVLILLAMGWSFWNMVQILIRKGLPFGKVEWILVALCAGYLPLFYVLGRKALTIHKAQKAAQDAENAAAAAEQAKEDAREKLELYGEADAVANDESKSIYDC